MFEKDFFLGLYYCILICCCREMVSKVAAAAAAAIAKKTFKGVSTKAQPYMRTNTVLGYSISL